jgi:hypothetical protein
MKIMTLPFLIFKGRYEDEDTTFPYFKDRYEREDT